jgi:hypothetical protein
MVCAACHIHPPCLPDLAPGDFYLFPTVKEKLEWIQAATEDEFSESLQKILKGMDQVKLNGAFQV